MMLKEQDDGGLELWGTPLGDMWTPAGGGLEVVLSELDTGVYASESGNVAVREGDTVIDCGAHVGAFCRDALNRGAKHVVAVEITPGTRTCLERNLAREIEDGRAIIVSEGVWSTRATLNLNTGRGSLSNTVMEERSQMMGHAARDMIAVPVTTLDLLVENLGLAGVDYIKMDIEGAEREAIVGAMELLREHRPKLAIAAYHLPDDRETIRARLYAVQPAYEEELGACLILHGRVIPETLFYA